MVIIERRSYMSALHLETRVFVRLQSEGLVKTRPKERIISTGYQLAWTFDSYRSIKNTCEA